MKAHALIKNLLEADDDIDPRHYLLGTSDELMRQMRVEMEKRQWRFARLIRPTEALFSSEVPGKKLFVWIYVWQGRLHAYGKAEFFYQGEDRRGLSYEDWIDKDVEEIVQEPGTAPSVFADLIDLKYSVLESPEGDEDSEPEPPDFDDIDE